MNPHLKAALVLTLFVVVIVTLVVLLVSFPKQFIIGAITILVTLLLSVYYRVLVQAYS